jgi:hypothetical protein
MWPSISWMQSLQQEHVQLLFRVSVSIFSITYFSFFYSLVKVVIGVHSGGVCVCVCVTVTYKLKGVF